MKCMPHFDVLSYLSTSFNKGKRIHLLIQRKRCKKTKKHFHLLPRHWSAWTGASRGRLRKQVRHVRPEAIKCVKEKNKISFVISYFPLFLFFFNYQSYTQE